MRACSASHCAVSTFSTYLKVRKEPVDCVSEAVVAVWRAAAPRDRLGVGVVQLAIDERGDDLHQANGLKEPLPRLAAEGPVELQLRAPVENDRAGAARATKPHDDRAPMAGGGGASEAKATLAPLGPAPALLRHLHRHQSHNLPPLAEVDRVPDIPQGDEVGIFFCLAPRHLSRQHLGALVERRCCLLCRLAARLWKPPPAVVRLRRWGRALPLPSALELIHHGEPRPERLPARGLMRCIAPPAQLRRVIWHCLLDPACRESASHSAADAGPSGLMA